jgi:hypothetical protein
MYFHDIFVGSVVAKFCLGAIAILIAKLLSVEVMKRFPDSLKAIIGIYVVTAVVVVLIFVRFVGRRANGTD